MLLFFVLALAKMPAGRGQGHWVEGSGACACCPLGCLMVNTEARLPCTMSLPLLSLRDCSYRRLSCDQGTRGRHACRVSHVAGAILPTSELC